MDKPSPPPEPPKRKKIRLTKTELYAMRMSVPKRNKLAFGLVGLLILAALGCVLWHFQDVWLPYWLPADRPAAPGIPQAGAPPAAPAGGIAPDTPAPAAEAAETPLDFLSAAAWDQPQFHRGVRLFNQALDRFRGHPNSSPPREAFAAIAAQALEAATLFESLRAEAPPAVPLADYAARCRRLANAARSPDRTGAAPAAPVRAAPAATSAEEDPPRRPGEPWRHPDYVEGARLFNRALDQYRQFLADKSQVGLLRPIEEQAFQAAKKFEALKKQAPADVPLADHITQCYKLISDCRRQNLEGAGSDAATPFERGTAGPNRRPALPAYQPPP